MSHAHAHDGREETQDRWSNAQGLDAGCGERGERLRRAVRGGNGEALGSKADGYLIGGVKLWYSSNILRGVFSVAEMKTDEQQTMDGDPASLRVPTI